MTQFVFAMISILMVQVSACKLTPLASDVTQSQTAETAIVRNIWISHPDILPKPNESISSVKQRMKDLARKLIRLNFNTVYLSVYGDGKLFWPSTAMQKAGGLTTQMNWANEARQIFRDEGLWVAAWFEYGLAVGAGSHPLALAHPDWPQQRQKK